MNSRIDRKNLQNMAKRAGISVSKLISILKEAARKTIEGSRKYNGSHND